MTVRQGSAAVFAALSLAAAHVAVIMSMALLSSDFPSDAMFRACASVMTLALVAIPSAQSCLARSIGAKSG